MIPFSINHSWKLFERSSDALCPRGRFKELPVVFSTCAIMSCNAGLEESLEFNRSTMERTLASSNSTANYFAPDMDGLETGPC